MEFLLRCQVRALRAWHHRLLAPFSLVPRSGTTSLDPPAKPHTVRAAEGSLFLGVLAKREGQSLPGVVAGEQAACVFRGLQEGRGIAVELLAGVAGEDFTREFLRISRNTLAPSATLVERPLPESRLGAQKIPRVRR